MVSRAAAEIGLPVEIRDDRLESGGLDAVDLPPHVRHRPMSAPVDASWAVVVSVLSDGAIRPAPGAHTVVRWSRVRAELASRHEARVQAARAAGLSLNHSSGR